MVRKYSSGDVDSFGLEEITASRKSQVRESADQPGWLALCNTGLKVISEHRSSPAHVVRPLSVCVVLVTWEKFTPAF